MNTVEDLKGHTLSAATSDETTVTFTLADGRKYQLYHQQDCCEGVYVESIVGDLNDLVGSPLLMVEEAISKQKYVPGSIEHVTERLMPTDDHADNSSNTWTFYKFATIKGYVDIRFHGSSNGYYSEGVDFGEIE